MWAVSGIFNPAATRLQLLSDFESRSERKATILDDLRHVLIHLRRPLWFARRDLQHQRTVFLRTVS